MKMYLQQLVLISVLLIIVDGYRINDDTLELVHVLFRHGDRTPDRHVIYPNDPHINHTYHPVGYGQLTNAGKRKEYLLGKALHKRYGRFLGKYNIETVDARCTDYNRTKMSLQLVLASLFPPQDDLVWEKRLKWQPVPFNYWTLKDDHVLGDPYKNCPLFHRLYFEFLNTTDGLQLYQNYTHLYRDLSENTGYEVTPKHLADLYFTLITENENGLALPQWTKTFFPDLVREFAILDYNSSTYTDQLKRLSSGFFLKKLIEDTRNKIHKHDLHTKMYLYSAHEYNLAYLLRYLGIFEPHVPPYGAYILVEIHNINGIRGVKIFYQDYTTEKPRRFKLPNCENFCRFEKFANLYKKLLPLDDKECF